MSKQTTVTMWDEENCCMHTFEQPPNWDDLGKHQKRDFIKRAIKHVFEERKKNSLWRNWIWNRRGDKAEIHKSIRERTQAAKDLRAYGHRRDAAEYKNEVFTSIFGLAIILIGLVAFTWVWVNIGAGAIIGCMVIFAFFMLLIVRPWQK